MARDIYAKVAKEFAKRCEDIATEVFSIWGESHCYWDNSPYAVRQFVLTASHRWGTAYCSWNDEDRLELEEKLRAIGATSIKVSIFKWDRVYITFNLKVQEQKRLERRALDEKLVG